MFFNSTTGQSIRIIARGETDQAYLENLKERLQNAQKDITIFAICHTHLLQGEFAHLLLERAQSLPVKLYLLNPQSAAKEERYRLEPPTARFHQGHERFETEVLQPALALFREAQAKHANLHVFLYDFVPGEALEKIDNQIAVITYGLGTRGTSSPVIIYDVQDENGSFFAKQVKWLNDLTEGQLSEDAKKHWLQDKKIMLLPIERYFESLQPSITPPQVSFEMS